MKPALLTAILISAIVSWTFAQTPTTQPTETNQRLQRLFDDLAHKDADVRERARIELMGLDRVELALLRQVVERSRPLLPAQALGLREIVMQAYLAADPYPGDNNTGFLGVQLGNVSMEEGEDGQSEGVLITGRIIGFAGYRMLHTGDIVLRVMQHPNAVLRSHAHLATLIRTFPAGAVVRLEVLRQGQVIQVPLRLDARPLELQEAMDLDNFQWRRNERFHHYWNRTFAPLLAEEVS